MNPSACKIVDDLFAYVMRNEKTSTIEELEVANLAKRPYDIRFLCRKILSWIDATPSQRQALLSDMHTMLWYPILAGLIAHSKALSTFLIAGESGLRFADNLSESDVTEICEHTRKIYKPYVAE
jgi:hypothetical protein